MSAGLAGWAIEALIASALLMAAVLAVRGSVRRVFGPQVAYALWALPLLRLVMPPLPAAWRDTAATPISRAGETVILVFDQPAAAAAPSLLLPALGLLWLAGAVAFLGWQLARHAIFCRRILADAERIERDGDIRIVTSATAPGPLAFGLWRRYVAFPADFAERYDADERALALAHELGHHRRGDLAANWAALIVLALHWGNPLAWRAFRAFRADQELANDAQVLAGRNPAQRHVYARAIVKAAHGGAISAACHFHTIADLKGRLKMLSLSPASRRRLASGTAAVGALVAAGLGLTASGSGAAVVGAGVRDALAQTAPVVPTPPAPPVPAASETPVAPTAKPAKVRRVVVVKDGKTQRYEGAEADAYLAANPLPVVPVPPVPPVPGKPYRIFVRDRDGRTDEIRTGASEAVVPGPAGRFVVRAPVIVTTDCPGGDNRQAVYREHRDGTERMLICTNRIEAMAREAQRSALSAQDVALHARENASASLATARAAIVADRNLTDGQRRQALAGVDQAQAELAAQKD